VIGLDVARRKPRRCRARRARHELAAQADEAGVLARAVVVQRAGLFAAARQLALRGRRGRASARRTPARRVHAGLGQHAGGGARAWCGLAAVRGAGQRQFLVGQLQRVGGAAGHQRQRLQHLDGRAREDRAVDVAQRGVQRAGGVDDGHRAAVGRLDDAAAPGLHQLQAHGTDRPASALQRMGGGLPVSGLARAGGCVEGRHAAGIVAGEGFQQAAQHRLHAGRRAFGHEGVETRQAGQAGQQRRACRRGRRARAGGRPRGRRRQPAQQRGVQVLGVHRLGDVVVHAGLQAGGAVFAEGVGGHRDDGLLQSRGGAVRAPHPGRP
jgi:hypothetical protein